MIKAIILLTLLAYTVSNKTWEVELYRGNIALCTASMHPDEFGCDISLRNRILYDGVGPDHMSGIAFSETEGSSDILIPFRQFGPFNVVKRDSLGAIVQSTFTSENGDEILISISLGFCCNDFEFQDAETLVDELENKRQVCFAKLSGMFDDYKREAEININAANTLDELRDDHADKKAYHDKLVEENKQLESDLEEKNAKIHEIEESEFDKTKKADEVCSSIKLCEANIFTLEQEIKNIEGQVSEVESQINEENTLTEEDYKKLDEQYIKLTGLFNDMKKYNSKLPTIELTKGTVNDSENLKVLFTSVKK